MKDRGKAFLESYRNSSPVPFLVIFSLFLVSRMLFLPFWKASMISPVTILSQYVRAAVLWLTFLYIAAFFVIQHVTIRTFLTGAVFAVTAMALCTHFIQNEMQYAVLMTVLLLLLSYGRSFRRLMKAVLIAHCVILAVGMTGFLAGLTVGIYKYENYGQGFSFGMYYPNTFARIISIILVLIWYLLQHIVYDQLLLLECEDLSDREKKEIIRQLKRKLGCLLTHPRKYTALPPLYYGRLARLFLACRVQMKLAPFRSEKDGRKGSEKVKNILGTGKCHHACVRCSCRKNRKR